jgi:hypothetical protein
MVFAEGRALAGRVISTAMTVLGIVLALVPLALWVAWTEIMLMIVLAVAFVAAALLTVLAEFENNRAVEVNGGRSREAFTEESIAEVHRIFPLVYHHSLNKNARFSGAMERVRHLTRTSSK